MRNRMQSLLVALSLLAGAPLAAQQADAMHDHDVMAMPHGTFAGADGHKAKGSYELVTSNGRTELRLGKDFSVDRGPDVHVVLSPSERVPAEGALYLGKLTRFTGEQSFAVPAGTDLANYSHVVLWCRKYAVPMGTAALGGKAMMDKMGQ